MLPPINFHHSPFISRLRSQSAEAITLANKMATLPNATNPMRISKRKWSTKTAIPSAAGTLK